MNSLEFIEKEIEQIEREIKYKKLYIENNPNDKPLKLEIISIMIGSLEKKLTHLQQIKCELEAWEELNKNFEIGVEEQIEEIYITGKNYYGNERTIWGYSKDGTSKVKKALEVEDE